VVQKGILDGTQQIIKSGLNFAHINKNHAFESAERGNKFLQGANINSLVDEALAKTTKKVEPSSSVVDDIETSQFFGKPIGTKFPSYVIDVDMGRQIGTNQQKTTARNSLRIIITDDKKIITAFPR